MIIVHCPPRQDVENSNAFPISQNLPAALSVQGTCTRISSSLGTCCAAIPFVTGGIRIQNCGSSRHSPQWFATGSFHLLYHGIAKCQCRLYPCLVCVCECVSIHDTLRAQAWPLLCSVKAARSFCGKYTRCYWMLCIVILLRRYILLLASLADVMFAALA
jgi:hypothetical protein